MKLMETAYGDVRVLPLDSASEGKVSRGKQEQGVAHFEVDFRLHLREERDGAELCHRITVSTSVLNSLLYSDRLCVEDEAVEQLPRILREAADQIQQTLAKRGPRVRKS
jgi:hypothetical protein